MSRLLPFLRLMICSFVLMTLATISAQATPTTSLMTVGYNGTTVNGSSTSRAMSNNGRFIAFDSTATNLVPGDTNGANDVFVYDRILKTTERISVASSGVQGNGGSSFPAISGDGRYVAFLSDATNLVPGDTNSIQDVFLRDRVLGVTTRISVSNTGAQANSTCADPSISADGRFIAFGSRATNLVGNDSNGKSDIFLYDRVNQTLRLLSMTPNGTQGNDASYAPILSADGHFIAFMSAASNFVTGDNNGYEDAYLCDRITGTITRVSVGQNGEDGNKPSTLSAISGDGRYVSFQSIATNFIPGFTPTFGQVYLKDRATGTLVCISRSTSGDPANGNCTIPVFSANGRYIVYPSKATNLAPGASAGVVRIYLYDRQIGTNTIASVATDGSVSNGGDGTPLISADGSVIAFNSSATNLGSGGTAISGAIYLREGVTDGVTRDTRVSLLFQNTQSRGVNSWTTTGSDFVQSTTLWAGGSTEWTLIASKDLTGDGIADALFVSTNGAPYLWTLNTDGNAIASSGLLRYTDGTEITSMPDWEIVAVADFNHDGMNDLLLKNKTTSEVRIWNMNGRNVIRESILLSAGYDADWKVFATPDLNHDGTPDILFRHSKTGSIYRWILNADGTNIATNGYVYSAPLPGWTPLGASDLAATGDTQVLFRNDATGGIYRWTLTNGELTANDWLYNAPLASEWEFKGFADMDGDGVQDILWQNKSLNVVGYWLIGRDLQLREYRSLSSGNTANLNLLAN